MTWAPVHYCSVSNNHNTNTSMREPVHNSRRQALMCHGICFYNTYKAVFSMPANILAGKDTNCKGTAEALGRKGLSFGSDPNIIGR